VLLLLVRKALGVLPWRAAVALGAAAGEVAYRLRIRRRVVFGNLALAFPDWSMSERRRVAHQTYLNAGRMFVECLLLPTLSPEQMDKLVEGVDGLGFAEIVGAGHKALVGLTGHMGNWELMGAYFARHGYRFKVFVKPLHNPHVEAALLEARRRCGLDVIHASEGLKPALHHLREGGALAFLADQDARNAGIAVPFFGVPASTVLGPAVFSVLGKVPILPIFAIRVSPTRHRFVIFPAIEPVAGEKRAAAMDRLTRAHVEVLEHIVRKHPEQYFWFHRRWKTPVKKLKSKRRTSAE
jgi:KDO2-lipid IV(A) lauroyltransferase